MDRQLKAFFLPPTKKSNSKYYKREEEVLSEDELVNILIQSKATLEDVVGYLQKPKTSRQAFQVVNALVPRSVVFRKTFFKNTPVWHMCLKGTCKSVEMCFVVLLNG